MQSIFELYQKVATRVLVTRGLFGISEQFVSATEDIAARLTLMSDEEMAEEDLEAELIESLNQNVLEGFELAAPLVSWAERTNLPAITLWNNGIQWVPESLQRAAYRHIFLEETLTAAEQKEMANAFLEAGLTSNAGVLGFQTLNWITIKRLKAQRALRRAIAK